MAKRKPVKTQYERKLVQQQIRRMEERGYRIPAEVKQKIKIGKYQTLHSYRRDDYKKLYSVATGEIDGKIVSGTEYRAYERKISAEKAAETRKQNEERKIQEKSQEKEQQNKPDVRFGSVEQASETDVSVSFEEARRKQDEIDRARAEMFQEGQIVYDQVVGLINDYPTPGSKYLNNLLKSEIATYGKDKVILAMSQAPSEYIESAKLICYYEEDSDKIHQALHDFSMAIRGSKDTAEEAKETGEVMDQSTDMGAL